MKDCIFKCKEAFTLAEVLVTMGIIGVVAAMTVPTLMQNYQRQSFVTQLRKVYSEVGQAAERYKSDNNVVSLRESRLRNNSEELNRFMNTYFKVVRNCNGSYAPCFADYYETIEGKDIPVRNYSCKFTGVLASGAAICADSDDSASSTPADRDVNGDGTIDENDVIKNDGVIGGAVLGFDIDVNGPQGPNIGGRDLFSMAVAPDGTVFDPKYVSGQSPATNGSWGIGKILEDGWQMNY